MSEEMKIPGITDEEPETIVDENTETCTEPVSGEVEGEPKVLYDEEEGIDSTSDETENSENSGETMDPEAFKAMFSGLANAMGGNSESGGNNCSPEQENTEENKIQNVFERKAIDEPFVINSACPICRYTEKKIVRLVAYKKGLLSIFSKHRTKVIGTVQICQNCGHMSFNAFNINEALACLKGNSKGINFEDQPDPSVINH
nr:MAG TPA: nucleic-acid-binding protein [Caudoviricetes sp.]